MGPQQMSATTTLRTGTGVLTGHRPSVGYLQNASSSCHEPS